MKKRFIVGAGQDDCYTTEASFDALDQAKKFAENSKSRPSYDSGWSIWDDQDKVRYDLYAWGWE